MLDGLEKTLRKEFMSNLSKSTRRDSHELIADIFNSLDRNTESRFMEALEERNRESAERVKSLMFTFEDLIRVDAQGIQILLRNIDKDKLAVALKGASETIKDLFFNNMSSRAGKFSKKIWRRWGRFACVMLKKLSSISLPRPRNCLTMVKLSSAKAKTVTS